MLKEHSSPEIETIEVDAQIDPPEFGKPAAHALETSWEKSRSQ